MARQVEADYLVVGAGAMVMAFTDALIDHADVRVALVDRRHGVGGHWLGVVGWGDEGGSRSVVDRSGHAAADRDRVAGDADATR